MPGQFSITPRSDGEILTGAKYNADRQEIVDHLTPAYVDDYSINTTQMRVQSNPGGVGSESLPTTLAGEIAELRYTIADDKGTAYWYSASNVINVKSPKYGATGDGTTDDYAAIVLALAQLTSGGTLYFPRGTYRVSHGICIPYSGITIRGDGVGVTTIQAMAGVTATEGLLAVGYTSSYASAGGIENTVVENINFDGNDLCWCIKGIAANRTLLTRLYVSNSLRALIQFYSSDDVTVSHCVLTDSNATDQFGDALYFGGCARPKALFNYISDFKRIGVVTEANGGTKSSDALIVGNYITYAHDNSGAEVNGGVFCENTASAEIIGNRITNLYNTPGTEKPRGIAIGPNSGQTAAYFHILGNHIEDTHYGLTINPTGTNSSVLVEGNVVRAGATHAEYRIGLHIGGVGSIKIINNTFGPQTYDVTNNPGKTILVDASANINMIHMESNDVSGIVHYSASADFHIFALNGFTISNLRMINQQAKMGMKLNVNRIYVSGCELTGDDTTDRPFRAELSLQMINSVYTTTGGTAMITGISGCIYQFTNCIFPYLAFAMSTSSSTVCNIAFTGCQFGTLSYMDLSGPVSLTLDGCRMTDYRTFANGGFIRANATNTVCVIRIRDCDFVHAASEIPLKAWTFQPTSVLVSNTTSPAGVGQTAIRGYGADLGEGNSPVDIIATANLPAAAVAQNGRIIIEDNGAGDRNLILYAGGERFRIDGGANV